MQITLRLTMNQSTSTIQTIESDSMGKLYEMIDYWQNSDKINVFLKLGEKEYSVEYCLTGSYFLNHMVNGELFGIYVGDMFFVSAEIARNRPKWVIFILAKLFYDRAIKSGDRDVSGRIPHYQSLFFSIRMANDILDEKELDEFLITLATTDRSDYANYDEEFRKFLENKRFGREILLERKRKYLQHHHENQWVRKGRQTEELLELDSRFGLLMDGFVNHAERIYQLLLKDSSNGDVYLASQFIRQVMYLPDGSIIEVSREFTGMAYKFQKECNGLVSLFVPHHIQPRGGNEFLVKTSGKSRTWIALLKRLSFGFHRAELDVQELIADRKEEFNNQVYLLEQYALTLASSKKEIEALIESGNFEAARKLLLSISRNNDDTDRRIEASSSLIVKSLKELSDLSDLLKSNI